MNMEFDRWARWSYERLLLSQPHTELTGLWKLNGNFYAVCPTLEESALTIDGKSLQDWFHYECRAITSPIRFVATPPVGAEPVALRNREQMIMLSGSPRTNREVLSDLSLALPREFPNFAVDDLNGGVVSIKFPCPLTNEEQTELMRVYEELGLPKPMRIEVVPELEPQNLAFRFDRAANQGIDLDLLPSRRLPKDIARHVKFVVEDDEDFWATNRLSILGSASLEHPREALTKEYVRSGAGCLVNASVFPREDIRNYLCLYDTVHLVLPLVDFQVEALDALGMTQDELVELVCLGRVRLLLPQAVDRYDSRLLAQVTEASPHGVLLSRRLAAATIIDMRRRSPLLYPLLSVSERRLVLEQLAQVINNQGGSWIYRSVVLNFLIDSWSSFERAIHNQGAMGTAFHGIPDLVGRLVQSVRGQDRSLEIWAAGGDVEWASALNAHLVPVAGTHYSAESASDLVAGALGLISTKARPPILNASAPYAIHSLLGISNDMPLLPFAREFGRGNITGLRKLIFRLLSENVDPDTLQKALDDFNAEVRECERRPDRLRVFEITSLASIAIRLADQEGAFWESLGKCLDLVFLPVLLLRMVDDKHLAEHPGIGAFLNCLKGRLARRSPETVLVCRARKHIKILGS